MKRAFTIATWRGTAFKLHVTFPLGVKAAAAGASLRTSQWAASAFV